jgi:hypothetical protein
MKRVERNRFGEGGTIVDRTCPRLLRIGWLVSVET